MGLFKQLELLPLLAATLAGISCAFVVWAVLDKISGFHFEPRKYKVQTPLMFKLLLPLARGLAPEMRRPTWEPSVRQAEIKLTMAGLEQVYTPEEFVALRLLYGIIFISIGLVLLMLQVKVLFFLGIFVLILGLIYPAFWLKGRIKERHRAIQRALPNVLDLLTLSVEAGRDFLTALRDILQNRERDPLGEELERVFREVQLGKQRRQALRAMAKRTRQNDVNTMVETLVQADELGVSIGHILRILGDQMRQKRFSRAEKLANESPVKLLLPLFLFIFPAVIIIMLGPVLLRTWLRFR